jgi:hypothetical protein
MMKVTENYHTLGSYDILEVHISDGCLFTLGENSTCLYVTQTSVKCYIWKTRQAIYIIKRIKDNSNKKQTLRNF